MNNFFLLHFSWKIKKLNKVLPFLFVLLSSSCSFDEIFYEFHSFPHSEWDKQTVIQFEVPIKDISVRYDIFFELRHSNAYPFRNLWLFANYQIPNGNNRQDTLHTELADIYGKWYGNGIHLYSYTFPYQLNVQYPDTGTYVYTIRQGMRENLLKGISEFGLRIVKQSPK